MDLTVIIPTRNRRAVVRETLDRLERPASEVSFEAVVVDDGSTDGTLDELDERITRSPFPLTLLSQNGLGPATARNAAIAIARAPVCLFIDDDTWPRPQLLPRHRDFHGRHPEREAALLGFTDIAMDPPPTPFMLWFAEQHLGFAAIDAPEDVGGRFFFSGNVSAKTEFLRSVGGFDEGYPLAGHEDIDLGLRLEERGLRLTYDPEAAVEHYHPADLGGTIRRLLASGASLSRSAERHPGREAPRRPDLRHRVKASALTVLAAAGIRTPRIRRETWRFLLHHATREGYWSALGSDDAEAPTPESLRIGRTLTRLAIRDPDAHMPPPLEAHVLSRAEAETEVVP